MCLIKDYHMVLEQIWIINALSYKYSISDVPKISLLACSVAKADWISHFFTNLLPSFECYTMCHTHCRHFPRLSYYHIQLFDSRVLLCHILFNQMLFTDNSLLNDQRIQHLLWQLCWFTWSSVSCDDTHIMFWYNLLNLLFVFEDR